MYIYIKSKSFNQILKIISLMKTSKILVTDLRIFIASFSLITSVYEVKHKVTSRSSIVEQKKPFGQPTPPYLEQAWAPWWQKHRILVLSFWAGCFFHRPYHEDCQGAGKAEIGLVRNGPAVCPCANHSSWKAADDPTMLEEIWEISCNNLHHLDSKGFCQGM